MLKFANKGLRKNPKKLSNKWNLKFFTKAYQDPQKHEKNSGQSVENRTISGNPYYLVLFEIVLYRGLY